MLASGFGQFLEPEEFARLRNDVAALRSEIQKLAMETNSPLPLDTPDAKRIRSLQLLLIHLKEQNKRAKIILNQLLSESRCEKSVSAIPVSNELPELSIEIFARFTEEIEWMF